MDTTTTIIGVCLLLLSIAPVIWARHKTRQKELRLKSIFDQLVSSNNLKLTQWENINGKLIGIDEAEKMLVFVSPQCPEGLTIDLNKRNGYEILKNKKESRLDLHTKVPEGSNYLTIPFFDNEKDDMLRFDYFSQKADEWLRLIRQTI